jgi:hypothetical protein
MNRYLKNGLVFVAGVFMAANVNAQCVFGNAFGTGSVGSIGQTVTFTTCAFAGEYSTANNVVAGLTYEFSSVGGSGNYITLTDTSNNVLQHGPSPQSYTATFSGTVRMHIATNASCGTESACRTTNATTLSSYDGPNALFQVSKIFTDGNPGEVEVSLSCNTGLILDQSKIISEEEGVTFVVTDFDSGELNCEITETPVAGYDASYFDGSSTNSVSCEYLEVEEGDYNVCRITNEPAPVDIEITKNWIFEGSSVPQGIDERYELTLYCDAEIVDGDWVDDKEPDAPTGGGDSYCSLKILSKDDALAYEYADWCKRFYGNGPEVFDAQVIPEYPDSECFVVERVYDDAVEIDNGCGSLTVSAGEGDACTITNTVFFEGIPTLSRHGVAVLGLLMLGIGFVGLRRFL